jgi:hypothetical protein
VLFESFAFGSRMGQFIYFVPGAKGEVTPAALDAIGLGHVHDGLQPECLAGTGPEGLAGVLCGFQLAPGQGDGKRRSPRYKKAEQTWHAGPVVGDKPAWWVGYWNGEKPAQAELRRKRFIAGNAVRLLDGADWTVPLARATVRATTLPKLMQVGTDGKTWRPSELPEFLGLCGHAERAYEVLLQLHQGVGKNDADRVSLSWQESMEIVTDALAVNYRVSAVELSLLQLVGDGEIWDLLGALCDWDALLKVIKERLGNEDAPGTSPTVSGSGAS